MLVFETSATREFVKIYGKRLASELPDCKLPHETPMPGEESVLRTFSSEWLNYDWDGQAYWAFRPDIVFKSMNFMLDLARRPVNDKLVLEVGIGIGGIADYMAREEGCELVGIDLSYAVDSAYRHFGRQPFLHIVQASAFAPPFRHNIFDLVYSQGVLHHTFSTERAFEQISKLPKMGGRLYVWIYSHYDEQRTLTRRALMLAERIIRPICWRLPETLQTAALLPLIPLYLAYQKLQARRRSGYVKFGWREAVHAARDRFTPRYVSRHTEDEVCDWFHRAGYGELQRVSKRDHPDFVPVPFVCATAVDGVRCEAETRRDSSCAA
jgi:SAM-dependent methyltransferase